MRGKLAWAHGAATCLGTAGLALASCGGLSPGEYVVYRVSFAAADPAENCYGGGIPDDIADESSSYRTNGLFVLYQSVDDKLYLDMGSAVLEGTADGDDYKFDGKRVDVTYLGPNCTGDRHIVTVSTEVEFTVDGAALTGTLVQKSRTECKGDCDNFDESSCTVTASFVGTEIEDPELRLDVEETGHASTLEPAETQCPVDEDDIPGPTGGASGSSGSGSSGSSSGGAGGAGPGDCTLDCSSGILYSCASGEPETAYEYCGNGAVSGVEYTFDNGHTLTCTFDCETGSGSCDDDTGATCSF